MELVCLIVCGVSLILRYAFINTLDIHLFMIAVNFITMWLSVFLICKKTKNLYKEKLREQGKDYHYSKSYSRLNILSSLLLIVTTVIGFIVTVSINGDYITIITLGFSLSDDYISKKLCRIYSIIFRRINK